MNNKNKNANVSSSITGATLQPSKESTGFKVGSAKVLSNEQFYASKDDPSTDMLNNINYSTPEDVKEFNERTEAIRAAGKK